MSRVPPTCQQMSNNCPQLSRLRGCRGRILGANEATRPKEHPMSFDTIIRNGRWFDGTGAPSAIRNIGIRDGHVAAISAQPLDETGCPQVIDAEGKWVLPGMVDIHTHYDVEVLGGPSLPESLRHGVTTVMVGSCSLSSLHLAGQDAAELFA